MKTISMKNRVGSEAGVKKFPRNTKIWLAVLVVIAIAAGGVTAYRAYAKPKAAAQATPPIQTAVARTGDLTVFASGTGQLAPGSQINLGFADSGVLSELSVQVGDQVKAGQVLAKLTTNNTEASIAAAVASAQLAVLNAQKNLDNLNASAQMNSANALLAVEQAQTALNTLQNPQLSVAQAQQAVADAQQALDTAQAAYNRTHMTASQANIDTAYAKMLIAQKNYEAAQTSFDQNYANKPVDNIERAQAQTRLSSAKAAYDNAVANYNASIGTANKVEQAKAEADLAAAQAKLADAQSTYNQVKDGPTPGEVAVAQAKLASAQADYARLKDGPDPNDVAIAQASRDNAKAQLELARQKQATEELTAPFDGTILAINANVGESVGSSSVITLADISHPLVQTYLDETDMDKVKVGSEADVVFDALPDKTFVGKVVEVNPSLVKVSNVSTVEAIVQLNNDPATTQQNLPVGLNASVDVISGRATNAVLVPIEAVRSIGNNQYAVFVMENGAPKMKIVTVGLQDLTSAQILSGVKAGDVVTTGTSATKQGN